MNFFGFIVSFRRRSPAASIARSGNMLNKHRRVVTSLAWMWDGVWARRGERKEYISWSRQEVGVNQDSDQGKLLLLAASVVPPAGEKMLQLASDAVGKTH